MSEQLALDFCKEACNLPDIERNELLDTEKYYNIFMMPTIKINDRFMHYMTYACIEHVLYTRKIQPIYYEFFANVTHIFKDMNIIQKVFSQYTTDEMIDIITYNVIPDRNVRVNDGKPYVYTMLLYSIIVYNNYDLFEYMLAFIIKYDLLLPKIITNKKNYDYVIAADDKRAQYIEQLREYDIYSIYKRSLRNAWILACTLG